jgi:Spirocyclase AveC-like
MATATVEPRTITRPSARPVPEAETKSQPVLWWAIVGGGFLAFAAYLVIAWVTGPNFHSVSGGPVDRPAWMATVQTIWQPVGIAVTIALLYLVLIRPWRRDGRPSTDGLMALACMALVIQDPWSSYVQHWFTYNTALPNMGSWVNEIPGWVAYGSPGHQVAEPLLWSPFSTATRSSGSPSWAAWSCEGRRRAGRSSVRSGWSPSAPSS